jgi:hypothetical protein
MMFPLRPDVNVEIFMHNIQLIVMAPENLFNIHILSLNFCAEFIEISHNFSVEVEPERHFYLNFLMCSEKERVDHKLMEK